MDSGFGVLPFIGGDRHNSTEDPPRGEPASDATGFGGVALFGHEDPVLDSVPEVSFENMDGCLQNSSEGYSPGFSERFDAGPVLETAGYNKEQTLDNSWCQLEQKPVEFFWESGFWADIFGTADDESSASSMVKQFSLHRPTVVPEPSTECTLPETVETSALPSKRLKIATYMDVVSKSSVQSWREHRDSTWEVAIRRWHSCAMTWKGDDRIVQMLREKPDFRGQCQILVDVLHHKAPGTLLKRCNSISRLVNDLHSRNLEFPCSEAELYEHLCRQRCAGAPSSRLKALLEAIVFVRHVFGCESLELATKSRRCMGAASSKEIETVRQAPPLTVEHLGCIHAVIESDEDAWNTAFCGMVLFCVYGRARWSDAQHSQFLEWDCDSAGNICFVECSTAVHKTCRALNMRHAFLPLTAPGVGVAGSCWAVHWQRARADLDIEDLSVFPLMPAPDEGGIPTVRPLSTSEAGKWLHVVLMKEVSKNALHSPLKYTSHSFKATCLSYLAKFGCSFEDRLALGYHTDQVRMALRYSRDGASRPLRVLEECIRAVGEKRFFPDETRSGRFVQAQGTQQSEPWILVENVEEGVKQETTDVIDGSELNGETIDLVSEYATTCSESSSGDEAVVLPKAPNRTLLIPEDVDIWKHVKLRTVHLAPKGNIRVLSCGRRITDKFRKEGIDHRFDVIKCKPCFRTISNGGT